MEKENSPAQQDSRMSDLEMIAKNSSAQRHSKFSKLGMGVMGDMRQERIVKKRSAQRVSKFSKLENRPLSPLCLFSPLASKNAPPQPHSKFSKLKKNQTLHFLHDLHGEMYSAQQDSKFSKSENRPFSPFSPSCLFSPLASKNSSAQRHSKMSNLITMWSGKTC